MVRNVLLLLLLPLLLLLGVASSAFPQTSPQWVRLDQLLEARPFLTERWVRRLVFERRIPFAKLGNGPKARLIFNLDDVDAMVESGRVEAVR
jgi:hypothetical protein